MQAKPKGNNCTSAYSILKQNSFLTLMAISTLLFLYGVAKNIIRPGCVAGEWGWVYRPLDVTGKLWLPVSIFLLAAVVIWYLMGINRTKEVGKGKEFVSVVILALLAFLICMSAFPLAKLGFDELPLIVINPVNTGYFNDAAKVNNFSSFVENYASRIPYLGLHSETHPPGPIFFFWCINWLMKKVPSPTALVIKIGDFLHLNYSYLSSSLILYGLPSERSTIATSIAAGLLMPFISSLTVIPLYYLGKGFYSRQIAFYAAALYVFIPSIIFFTPQMDQVFVFLAVSTIASFYLGLKRKNVWYIFLAGVIYSAGIFMSLGLLILLSFIGCLMAKEIAENKLLVAQKEEMCLVTHFKFSIKGALIFGFTIIIFYVLLMSVLDFNIVRVLKAISVEQQVINAKIGRTYSKWVIFNLYDFFAFLGVPISLLFFKRIVSNFSQFKKTGISQVDILLIALLVTLVALDVSGIIRGEVARVWMFLMPFAALVSAPEIDKIPRGRFFIESKGFLMIVLFLQFISIIVYKAFLLPWARPVLF